LSASPAASAAPFAVTLPHATCTYTRRFGRSSSRASSAPSTGRRRCALPYDFLDLVSLRIVNEVKGISRVAYDISGKPPATIEWE
jgi:hypothetical protein